MFVALNELGLKMIATYSTVVDYLSQEVVVLGKAYGVGEIIGGGLLITFLGWLLVSKIIDILP